MQTVESNVTRFERLGLEEGLSEAQIMAMFQDSQKFMWIGTSDGLNRYDAYTFKVYRHDPTNPASLSTNVIYAILEDSEGALWLGTDRGLERFDKRSEVFTPYRLDQQDRPGLDQVPVHAILEDAQGALWIGTIGQGLYRLDRRTGRWTAFQHIPENLRSLPSDYVTSLQEDAHGTLWVGTYGGGLCRLDRPTGEFAVYRQRGEDPQSLSSNNVIALCEDAQGILWIGTETGGLNALDTASGTSTFVRYQHEGSDPHSLSHDYVLALLEDATGTLWVGTGRGLNELDRERMRFRRHYHEEGDLSSPSHSEILSLTEDAQGLLWIGTRMGLNKFDRSTRAFGHFKRRDTPGALSSNTVSAFLEDAQGHLWIGTYGGGLNRSTTDGALRGFVHFDHREDDPHSLADRQALSDSDRPALLGDNAVLALCQDDQDRLWIGTSSGLHRLVPGDNPASPPTFLRYQHRGDNPSSLSHNLIMALADDGKGNLWIGTYGGLNKLEKADAAQGFVRCLHDENDPYSLSHDFVRTIYLDSAGNLWIGTNGGLNKLVLGDEPRFIRYQHDEQDPLSLSHDRVYCIAEDAGGVLWIGTKGGLNRFEPQTGQFTAYREQDGLSNDEVNGVLVDDQGCLWLANNRGIDRFDPATERFTHYDVYDGIQANEFTQGAFYRDRLGRLYFGGFNGFNVFHPDDIQESSYLPPVVLTNFLLANKPVPISESGPLREHITFAEQIELAPEDYVFAFEFSALNYRQPRKNHFAYRMEGFDRDWITTDARDRKAVYTNVPPGTYTFRVKAANDDGLWNEEGASIQVAVSQPWWHIVFRSAFEAVVIHDGETILQVNQAALELYGYEQAELIGQSMYKLVPPEFHAEVERHVSAGDETPYQAEGLRKDGSVFVSEVRGRALAYQGRVVRVAGIRDITERKRAEEAVRKSEQRYRTLFETVPNGVVYQDREGHIISANRAAERILGLTFDQMQGRTSTDPRWRAIHEDGSDFLGESHPAMVALKTGEEIRDVVMGVFHPQTDDWVWIRIDAVPQFRSGEDEPYQVYSVFEDITARRQAQAAMEASEAKFREFVEQSTDGIFVVDEEGAIIEWNPKLEEITGLTRQEVLGAPAWDVQHRLFMQDRRTPEVREQTRTALLSALQTGQASWLEETVQAVYQRADRATRYVEQRLFPIQTDQGFRIGGISADVTERRRAEAQLRTLSRAVEQSDSTIVVTDLRGTIEFVNPAFARTTGYTAGEALGQNPRILKSGEMPQEVYRDLWGTITRGRVWEGELLNKRKDGRYYWESAIISPVRDGAGNPTHYVAVKQDITTRKQAEQALERRVSHEKALAACSAILLRGDGPQALNRELLNKALAPLVESVQASRAYVFRNFQDPKDGFCSGIVAEAVVPGLPKNLESPFSQKIPWSSAPVENRRALRAGQPVGGPTAKLFASTPELMNTLLEDGILSVQFFPIHFADEWWGYVGFDDCQTAREWDEEETLVLGTASQVIGSALQRWQAEAALQEAHDELEQRVRARTAALNDAVERLQQEVDQRQLAEAEVRERLTVQQGLANISTQLMQATAFDDALADVLAETGELVGADRVFLVRLQADGRTVYRVHEWCASEISPIFQGLEGRTLPEPSWWLDELRDRGRLCIEDIHQAPREFGVELTLLGSDANRALCAIPVYARQEMIGFLGLHGLAPVEQGFAQHLQVLEVIVGILGSAWLRERVLETLDQRIAARTRELSTFFDLTTLTVGVQDLSEMLASVPARVLELRACDAICIHLLDEERATLALAAQGNLTDAMRRRLQAIALDSGFLQRLDQLGDPIVVTGHSDMSPLPQQLRLEGFSSYLGVPLPSGWVSYYRASAQGFSLDESSLLLALAEQMGVSVENFRLRQRIEAAVTLEERGRLARDLHDSVTQSLYSLSLFARSGRDAADEGDSARLTSSLTKLETTAIQALREMRLLLYELRPEALEQEGLIRTIEQRFDAVERRAGIQATVACQAPEGLDLPPAIERDLYYLTMEALNNMLKHAQATEVAVAVELSATQVRLEITDDGRGFDPQVVSGGYGLGDMRERVERLGGRLEISSAPGAGTQIRAWVNLT